MTYSRGTSRGRGRGDCRNYGIMYRLSLFPRPLEATRDGTNYSQTTLVTILHKPSCSGEPILLAALWIILAIPNNLPLFDANQTRNGFIVSIHKPNNLLTLHPLEGCQSCEPGPRTTIACYHLPGASYPPLNPSTQQITLGN